jgi:hypothetical protein
MTFDLIHDKKFAILAFFHQHNWKGSLALPARPRTV